MGPLISESQRGRVRDYVEKASAEGAVIICGGRIPADEQYRAGFFFEPTVLGNVTPLMSIFHEEVFGPVACISRFSRIEDAVDLANRSDFALAGSIWSGDAREARRIAGQLNAGIIWINTYGMFYNEIPYGGFKQSGFGKELGREGFLEYCRLKSIIIDATREAKPIVNYWYGF
jgi:acyl-CoA reductase-like NAD-dependent aldehyde dehydrogenase